MNVYQRLNAAREEFHSLKLEKTGHNKFAGYYYFELGDFLIPAMKVFAKHGLCGMVSFEADKASMIVKNVEQPNEYILFTSPMGSANLKGCHEVQNIGAVETYQRRYLWVAALEIVEHDALDATTGKDKEEPAKRDVGGSAGDANRIAFNNLQPEIQNAFRRVAPQVDFAIPNTSKAIEIMEMTMDEWPNEDRAELKKGLWSLLDSKTRTAISKEQKR